MSKPYLTIGDVSTNSYRLKHIQDFILKYCNEEQKQTVNESTQKLQEILGTLYKQNLI